MTKAKKKQPRRKPAAAGLLAAAMTFTPPSNAKATMEEVYTTGFQDYLKDVEGFGAGYDKKSKKYYPYPDVKGNMTIGVGHKVLPDEIKELSKGITEEEVHAILEADVEMHMQRANTYVDSHWGVGAWKRLEPIQKQILTDYAYNPGLGKFPKFAEAIVNEDWEDAYAEMFRYAVIRDEDGNMTDIQPLEHRNQAFYDNFLKPLRDEQRQQREEMTEVIAGRALTGL